MKRAFLAAALLAALPGMAQAQNHHDIYAHHCSKDDAPTGVELWAADKNELRWNGSPITMPLFDAYLNDAMTHFISKGNNIYFYFVDNRHPPRPDVVAAMKKHGIIQRPECPPAILSIP